MSSETFQNPCSASSCILYSDRYIIRANQPSIHMLLPDEAAHQVADRRVLAERDERAEIAIPPLGQRLGSASRALICLTMCDACWCADCARGGTSVPSLPSHGQAAQSPIAKMFSIARGLQRRQHHELIDAVGLEPVEVLEEIGRLDAGRPHDQLGGNDLAGREPDAVGEHLRHARRRPDLHAQLLQQLDGAAFDRRSAAPAGCGRRLRPAISLMSCSGSMRSKPYETSVRVALCSSAASSTPVAPAPMMAMLSWSARSGPACACARRQAFTSRR